MVRLGEGENCEGNCLKAGSLRVRSGQALNSGAMGEGAVPLGGGSVRMVMIVGDPDGAFKRAAKAGPPWFGPSSTSVWWTHRTNRRSLRTPLGNRQAFGRRLTASLGLLLPRS